jgi:PAS domain S-box-containing protein
VYPRRDAMELMNSLHFQQAVMECAAVGIMVVDDDTRIINANPAALDIIGRSFLDVLNRPVADLFATEARAELIDGLKLVRRQDDIKKVSFYVNFHSRLIDTTISTIKMQDNVVGWVVVLTASFLNDPNRPAV